jgi:hypothetical protein
MLPRCADVCPHDAIIFYDETKNSNVRQLAQKAEFFHPEFQTQPRVRWIGLPKPWIAGTVIDQARDEVISGVAVTAVDLFENRSFIGQSDAFGDFWIRGTESGRKYRIEIRKDGYEILLTVVTTNGDQDLGTVALNRTR